MPISVSSSSICLVAARCWTLDFFSTYIVHLEMAGQVAFPIKGEATKLALESLVHWTLAC